VARPGPGVTLRCVSARRSITKPLDHSRPQSLGGVSARKPHDAAPLKLAVDESWLVACGCNPHYTLAESAREAGVRSQCEGTRTWVAASPEARPNPESACNSCYTQWLPRTRPGGTANATQPTHAPARRHQSEAWLRFLRVSRHARVMRGCGTRWPRASARAPARAAPASGPSNGEIGVHIGIRISVLCCRHLIRADCHVRIS